MQFIFENRSWLLNVCVLLAILAILWNLGRALYCLLRGSKGQGASTQTPLSNHLFWRVGLSFALFIGLVVLAQFTGSQI